MDVAIIGCGLIGTSLSLALRKAQPETRILGFDQAQRLPSIRDSDCVSEVFPLSQLPQTLSKPTLVFICTPVEITIELLPKLGKQLKAKSIITDVGSTKSMIMKTAQETLPPNIHFIGGHPIAGSEHTGANSANPLLFKDRIFVLCPTPNTPPEILLKLMDCVEDLLAIPMTMGAEEHDRILSMVSHVPQLLAMALMHAAMKSDKTHGLLDTMAGRGFLDQTRVAASEFSVWKSILETNLPAIDQALDSVENSLQTLRTAMAQTKVESFWEEISSKRRHMKMDPLPRNRKPDLRKLIDHCDEKLLQTLATRFRLVKKMGRLKSNQKVPVKDLDREHILLKEREIWGAMLELDPDLIHQVFQTVLKHSRKIQNRQQSGSKAHQPFS